MRRICDFVLRNPSRFRASTYVTNSLRRAARFAVAAGLVLAALGAATVLAGWESAGASRSGPTFFSGTPQKTATQASRSTFVPRWVPVNRDDQAEEKGDAERSEQTAKPSDVEQATAISLSGEKALPIGDPRLPEPMPDLTPSAAPESTPEPVPELTPIPDPEPMPELLQEAAPDSEPESAIGPKSKPATGRTSEAEPERMPSLPPVPLPELIGPGEETPSGTILPLDEYDGYTPGPMSGDLPLLETFGPEGYLRPSGLSVAGCDTCYDPTFSRLWVRADALLWWIQGYHVPALVTTSRDAVPTPFTDGALGEDDTRVLFGDGRLAGDLHSGGNIEFGYWLDDCQTVGVEAAFFGLARGTTTFDDLSDGTSVLARPFYDVQATAQSAWPVAMLDYAEGSLHIDASTEMLGTEVLFRRAMTQVCGTRVDLLAGYRYARLSDDLHIQQFSTALDDIGQLTAGSTLELHDDFSTRNLFHGAEIGVTSHTRRCRWTFETDLKLAFGSTRSSVGISGSSSAAFAGGAATTGPTGFLARATNIGDYSRQEFTMIPELGVHVGYDLTSNLRFRFGYTLLYWSKVARPGDQIDTNLDLARAGGGGLPDIPPAGAGGAHLPQFEMRTTDVWAQGLDLGVSYRF